MGFSALRSPVAPPARVRCSPSRGPQAQFPERTGGAGGVTQQAQYGREAGGHGLLAKQTRCWSATEGKRNLTEPLKLAAGPSCIGRCERGKLFRKGPVSARGGRAKKPAHLNPQHAPDRADQPACACSG